MKYLIIEKFLIATACILLQAGCASTYSNLTSGSQLGAEKYKPAVLVKDNQHSKYNQILAVCRQASINGQITAAQRAQLETVAGTIEGASSGLAFGAQMGSILDAVDVGGGLEKGLGIGLASGLIGSLGSSFASGVRGTADKSREVLLGCLRAADPGQEIYAVLE